MKTTSIPNLKTTTPSILFPHVGRVGVRMKNFAGFTIVEIITTIAIIAVISILGFTYANNYKLTQYNTVRASDIDLLNNTMQTYYETHKQYPLPAGNKQYFDEYGVYTHSATGAYGVSGFITSETFGKEFMLVTQKDPTTKYYYAYSRTLDNKPTFQFATSLDQQGTFYGYVKGTYSDNNLAGIVREYNGPNFVINNNAKYLPYNPNELKLTGNVISYSGGVQVIKDSKIVSVNTELEQGYQIKADTGALVTINLSDGSELRLGSNIRSSILNFNNLKYKGDDNLLTQISLKLSLGEVWVKAPQLEQGSEFSLETDNAAASVRGTVFGMTNDGNGGGSISLIEGKLEIFALDNDGKHLYNFPGINIGSTGAIVSTQGNGGASTTMTVPEGGTPVSVTYIENETNSSSSTTSTGTGLAPSTTSTVDQIMQPQVRIKSSYIPKILSFEKTSSTGSLKISNIGANHYRLKYLTGGVASSSSILPITEGDIDANSDNAIISLNNLNGVNAISFQICDYSSSIFFASRCVDKTKCTPENPENYCSSWKTIGFDDKPISVTEESLQKTEIQKQQADGCPDGQEWSTISNQCELPGLVAYAGYDAPGDIFMSVNSTSVLKTTTNNIVTTTEYGPYTTIGNKIDAWTQLKSGGGYGSLNRTPNFISSTQTFDTSQNGTITNNTGGFISYNENFSYFELPRANSLFPNGGIYLDAKVTTDNSLKDYLKYDLSPLQLGNNFTIEMSVRGAALKRSGGPFFLATTDVNNKYLLGVYGGKIYFGYSTSTAISGIISSMSLQNDVFYKIFAKTSQNGSELIIKDSDGNIVYNISSSSISPIINNGILFVGSNNSLAYQWNDIIDYIKIYKY